VQNIFHIQFKACNILFDKKDIHKSLSNALTKLETPNGDSQNQSNQKKKFSCKSGGQIVRRARDDDERERAEAK